MRTRIRLGIFVLFAASAFAQAKPDAAEILAKVKDTWKDLKSYDLDFAISLRDPKTGKEESGKIRVIAAIELNRYRVEVSGLVGLFDPSFDGVTAIYDGSTFWIYDPKRNEYRTDRNTVDDPGRNPSPSKVINAEGLGQYVRLVERFDDGHLVREETITNGSGNRAECFVIEKNPGMLMWIDKSNYHVLRVEQSEYDGSRSTTVLRVKLNEPLSDDLFKFAPPPGARSLGQP